VKYFETYAEKSGTSSATDVFKGYNQVTLATGNDFPDALVGAALAGKEKTPLFLVDNKSSNAELKDYISKWKLEKIYILGGETILPDTIKTEIHVSQFPKHFQIK